MFGKSLAHIERVKSVHPIEGADRIERVTVLDWNLIAKKGEFKEGDLALYVEIGSILPDGLEIADRDAYNVLAKKASIAKKYNNAVQKAQDKGEPVPEEPADYIPLEKLKEAMELIQQKSKYPYFEFLRERHFEIKSLNFMKKFGVISEGILFDPKVVGIPENKIKEGADFTEFLGITEPVEDEEEAGLGGDEPKFFLFRFIHKKLMRFKWYRWLRQGGNSDPVGWPGWAPPKSDETNAQKIYSGIYAKNKDADFVATEKLEGQSISIATRYSTSLFARLKERFTGEKTKKLYVMSRTRNLPFRKCKKMQFWKMVVDYGFDKKLLAVPGEWFIRGDHVGDGIQKNIYNLGGHDIRIYDVFPIDPETRKFVKRYNYEDTVAFCEKYGFQYVPVIDDHFRLPADVQELLVISTAKTVYGNNLSHLREGLVLRRRDDFSVSFKAKSPDYKI